MSILLAGDIGGSKTEIRIYDSSSDQILQKYTTIGYGLASDTEDDIPPLTEFLGEISVSWSPVAAAINLGGKNKTQIQKIFQNVFSAIPVSVFRESEGDAAFALGRHTDSQIILLCGTGSIGLGISPDHHKIVCGGWGMNIGDGGSGYDIGLTAIRYSLMALDQKVPLYPLVQNITGCTEPFPTVSDISVIRDRRDAVRARLFPLDRKKIASYTKIVAEFCQEKDPLAMLIMREAGIQLADLALNVSDKIGYASIRRITLTGGLIHTLSFWQEAFETTITSVMPDIQFTYMTDGILEGTYQILKTL